MEVGGTDVIVVPVGTVVIGDGNVVSVVGVGGSGIVNVGGDDDNLIIVVSFVGVGGSGFVGDGNVDISIICGESWKAWRKIEDLPSYISFELFFFFFF